MIFHSCDSSKWILEQHGGPPKSSNQTYPGVRLTAPGWSKQPVFTASSWGTEDSPSKFNKNQVKAAFDIWKIRRSSQVITGFSDQPSLLVLLGCYCVCSYVEMLLPLCDGPRCRSRPQPCWLDDHYRWCYHHRSQWAFRSLGQFWHGFNYPPCSIYELYTLLTI